MSTRSKITIGRVTFYGGRHRSKNEPMGRFGGGWNWKVGVTAGSWYPNRGMTILVSLLVDEYRITIRSKAAKR